MPARYWFSALLLLPLAILCFVGRPADSAPQLFSLLTASLLLASMALLRRWPRWQVAINWLAAGVLLLILARHLVWILAFAFFVWALAGAPSHSIPNP